MPSFLSFLAKNLVFTIFFSIFAQKFRKNKSSLKETHDKKTSNIPHSHYLRDTTRRVSMASEAK
jgi:hypothetical protein